MKKSSLMLALFLTLLISSVESKESCSALSSHLWSCVGEIINHEYHPITNSCCATVLGIAGSCPPKIRSAWFIQGVKSCLANQATSPSTPPPNNGSGDVPIPTPPPAPPSNNGSDNTTTPPPPAAPSSGGDDQSCPEFSRLEPCWPEIANFMRGSKDPMDSSCCAIILDLKKICSTYKWNDFYVQIQDYCKNHH